MQSLKLSLILFTLASLISLSALASNSLEISNIELVEDYYSEKIFKATFNYDGKLGNSNFFGAEAITNERVGSASYFPNRISKGKNEIRFSVRRPATESTYSFKSYSIKFTVYNQNESIVKAVDFELDWQPFEEFFETKNVKRQKYQFTTIKSLRINESIAGISGLVRDLVAAGIQPKNIDPVHIDNSNIGNGQSSFIFSESISYADFRHFITLLKNNDVALNMVGFLNIAHPNFKIGYIDMIGYRVSSISHVTEADINKTLQSNSLKSLFAKLQFDPTPRDELNQKLLDQAIVLNNAGGKSNGEKAKEIAEYLIDIGYQNSRIYAELARAYGRMYNYNQTALEKRRTILNMALSLFPNDQWAHALLIFDETHLGNYESAEKHAVLAKKYEKVKNVWTITNWARLYEVQGRFDEARAKYQELIGQHDLNDSNKIAHKRGLIYYANFLEREGGKGLSAVYRELIAAYPTEEKCTNVKLARSILINEKDYSEVQSLLGNPSLFDCENAESAIALLELRDWHKSGGQTSIQPIIIKHGNLTALIYEVASMEEGSQILPMLQQQNINTAISDQNGLNALHMSVASKNELAIDNMLSTNIDVNAALPNGWTALMIASYLNAPNLVEVLLKNGADKSLQSFDGYSAMSIAQQANFPEVIELLKGANL
ncbi:ankyrin repeat domain-containing protein [Thalassotalea fusca]